MHLESSEVLDVRFKDTSVVTCWIKPATFQESIAFRFKSSLSGGLKTPTNLFQDKIKSERPVNDLPELDLMKYLGGRRLKEEEILIFHK